MMFSRQSLTELPVLKQLHSTGLLRPLTDRKIGPYRGRFKTTKEAQASLPPSRSSSYDNEHIVAMGIESFSTIQSFDWPVLFQLQKLLREDGLEVVTDFGGHIGVKYYAYRDVLDFPKHMRWQVVDVPAMVREGRRRATAENTRLSFSDSIEKTAACDVLICSGVLQYADTSVEQLIEKMPRKPKMVLLNKIPISVKETGFVTLENFGVASVPYRIFTSGEIENARAQLGYRLVSNWTSPEREFAVLSSKGIEWIGMRGQAWAL